MKRVLTWTEKDGITGVTDEMPEAEAEALAEQLREANPDWLHVETEAA